MASRPAFRQENSFGQFGDAYEMQDYSGDAILSAGNGKTGETTSVEEDPSYLKGATVNDQHDMRRLGKQQELRVRWILRYIRINAADHARYQEELSLSLHIWLLSPAG